VRRAVLLLCLVVIAALGGRVSVGAIDQPAQPPRARSAASRMHGRIADVVDGDTLKVRTGGRRETVRLIGIDTPETHRPNTPVECGGPQATDAMTRRARPGTQVTLVTDPTQDRRDRYGRLLAYVDRADGVDLGRAQVRDGWADVYVYEDRAFKRLAAYRAAARKARDAHQGANGACGGDFHRPQ
jgi:micrococcal nuclease